MPFLEDLLFLRSYEIINLGQGNNSVDRRGEWEGSMKRTSLEAHKAWMSPLFGFRRVIVFFHLARCWERKQNTCS